MLTANGIRTSKGHVLPWTSERTVTLARCKTRVVRREFVLTTDVPAFHTRGCGLVSGRRDVGRKLVAHRRPLRVWRSLIHGT